MNDRRMGGSQLSTCPPCPRTAETPAFISQSEAGQSLLWLTLVKYEESAWCLPKCEFPHWSQGPHKPEPGSRRRSTAAVGGLSAASWGGWGPPRRASPSLSPGARHRAGAAAQLSACEGWAGGETQLSGGLTLFTRSCRHARMVALTGSMSQSAHVLCRGLDHSQVFAALWATQSLSWLPSHANMCKSSHRQHTKTNGHGCVPINLYSQKQPGSQI